MRIVRKNPQRVSSLPNEPVDLVLMDTLLEKYAGKKGSMIPLLQGTQDLYGYVPKVAIEKISGKTGLSVSKIFGVTTFYSQFRLNPVGKNIIKVCHGTACHVQNAKAITAALMRELGVEDGGTTDDKIFTLESVACLGCCSLAPVMMIGEDTFGKLTGDSATKIIKEMKKNENK